MVEDVPYSVLDETESFGRFCHIRKPSEQSDLEQSVFRKLRCGSRSEYERLDKIFWREREHGFSLADHQLVNDADDNPWLHVEYVDGVSGDELFAYEDDDVLDDFFSSYTCLLQSVIDNPEEPFQTDQRLEQYMYDGEEFVVTDLEPRVGYFDTNPGFRSHANQRFVRATSNLVETISDLRDDYDVSQAFQRAGCLVESVLDESSYFQTYNEFDQLTSFYDQLQRNS